MMRSTRMCRRFLSPHVGARLIAVGCAAVLIGGTAACESPTLPARPSEDVYDFRLISDTLHVFHWPAGSSVRVYIDPANGGRLPMLAAAFEHGAAEWNARALFGEYEIVRVGSLAEADVLMRWSDDVLQVDVDECEPTFLNAVTTFCIDDASATPLRLKPFLYASTGGGANDNVKMIVTIQSTQASIDGRVERLVAHEFGHMLGIGQHSPNSGDLMAAGLPPRSTLSHRDAATVQVLYHTKADIFP